MTVRMGVLAATVGALLACAASLSGSGFDEHLEQALTGGVPGSAFGAAVASAGDVDGDGYADLVVGAPDHSGAAGERSGKAFLFLGSPTGFRTTPSWSAEGELKDARFGSTVAAAGDMNADGFADVVIGSPDYNPPNPDYIRSPGRIYFYLGSASGLSSTPVLTVEGRGYDLGYRDGLGSSLARGDFNGDGFSDVVAGQYAKYAGDSRVYYGGPAGPTAESYTSIAPYAWYSGSSIAVADVNADGFSDLFFSHLQASYDAEPPPTTVVYLGSSSGLPALPPPGERPSPAFVLENWSIAANLGDFDRDGYPDMVATVGDPNINDLLHHVFFRGTPSGLVEHGERSPVLGIPGRLVPIGDLNGDGFPDVVTDDGWSLYLYFGSPSGFRPISDGMGPTGVRLAPAGDVNGDGFDDLLVGDPTRDRVAVYRGGTDWTLTVTADLSVQTDFDGSTFWTTIRNSGPDTVRVWVEDVFPRDTRHGGWGCYHSAGVVMASCMPPYALPQPLEMSSLLTLGAGSEMVYHRAMEAGPLPFVYSVGVRLPEWVVDPDPSNNQVTRSFAVEETALFSDDFESGTLAAWSSRSPAGLSVRADAAIEGQLGLRVQAPGSGSAVLTDDRPAGESTYHARFLFDASELGDRRGPEHLQATLFRGTAAAGNAFDLRLERRGRRAFLVGSVTSDGGVVSTLTAIAVGDGPHRVDVAWRRATGDGANDGGFAVRLDDAAGAGAWGLDNDALGGLESVELGLTLRAFRRPLSLRRRVTFDAFTSWRQQ